MELLSGKVEDYEAKAKQEAKQVRLEGVEGESLRTEEIKNGSRDRYILVKVDISINRSMAALIRCSSCFGLIIGVG